MLQFGEESGAPAVPGDGGATTPGQAAGRAWQQFLTSTSTPTLMVVAVSGCLLIVTLFVVIFTVLQVSFVSPKEPFAALKHSSIP